MKNRFSRFQIFLCLSSPAISHAADDPSSKALSTIVAPLLEILKARPEAASDACINSLRELRQTQNALESGRYDDAPSDYAIAHDVLESDFENTIQVCGADARRLCMRDEPIDRTFKTRCEHLLRQHPG